MKRKQNPHPTLSPRAHMMEWLLSLSPYWEVEGAQPDKIIDTSRPDFPVSECVGFTVFHDGGPPQLRCKTALGWQWPEQCINIEHVDFADPMVKMRRLAKAFIQEADHHGLTAAILYSEDEDSLPNDNIHLTGNTETLLEMALIAAEEMGESDVVL